MSYPQPERWGPSHQYHPPPRSFRCSRIVAGSCAAVLAIAVLSSHLVVLGSGAALIWALATGRIRVPIGARREPDPDKASDAAPVRIRGASLGRSHGGRPITADPEHAVMVLGPPRSGKTTSVVIPSLLTVAGPAVSTSTKPDVLVATWRARSELGQVWLFDPAGERIELPPGARRLCWSPVGAATSWDQALLVAHAMAACTSPGRGTSSETHWQERAAALLAPLLHAAHLGGQTISDVLAWVLRHDLEPAALTLEDHDAPVARDVLTGIAATDGRERSSILSAAAGVLAAYNSDACRRSGAQPNFDPARFVASTDTLYITAAAHRQALCAPLVVGLLEQIRHAAYARARSGAGAGAAPLFLCLDEVANIAPIHDLPALVSEAGGQGVHVLACLQDLSQARQRWGEAAEGFLSLFQTKLILGGIADSRTLESISLALGEYDRRMVSHSIGRSRSERLLPTPGTRSESVTYSTARQRTLAPGDVARLPAGRALLLRGTHWQLVRTNPHVLPRRHDEDLQGEAQVLALAPGAATD